LSPAWYRIDLTYPLPTTGQPRETILHVETELATDSELAGRFFAPAFDGNYHPFESAWDGDHFPIVWQKGQVTIRLNLSPRGESCGATTKLSSKADESEGTGWTVALKEIQDAPEN